MYGSPSIPRVRFWIRHSNRRAGRTCWRHRRRSQSCNVSSRCACRRVGLLLPLHDTILFLSSAILSYPALGALVFPLRLFCRIPSVVLIPSLPLCQRIPDPVLSPARVLCLTPRCVFPRLPFSFFCLTTDVILLLPCFLPTSCFSSLTCSFFLATKRWLCGRGSTGSWARSLI
ncbi:hypothetical protein OH76DRAFT_926487 [Lentinus brumalis]|uniref:Uncharacterized protein n=1 Tax=Lentinus brumalis TaxID=2498619 RepID=A0A371D075_9APHY|nr:hypothetical protein OH76DRAFT_926487 [Polyporus brumalis]